MRKGRRLVSPPPSPHHPSPHCISANSCDRPGRHLIHCNYSCQFVQFVGKTISLRAICLEGSTERSDGNRGRSPRIGKRGRRAWQALRHRTCLNQPLIALVQIRATDPVAILSLVTIRVHSCNSWAKINSLPIAPKPTSSCSCCRHIPHHCISVDSRDRPGRHLSIATIRANPCQFVGKKIFSNNSWTKKHPVST